ncbi:hypothetical protein LFYK43_16730 [Ligilactobacillus salitolerans]|uniref:Phage protein n=1 Tax=Ligilactobacillus salitolerans TaxID=1808352 RepID=A0A401IUL0_9LACO|nr:putative HNHc nuclease [Ligilactobacillus salitolerans]GBG95214.1 hypothetical protein LFYK43_16730 [Ligilactobacillus salitolerans]
MDVYGTLESVSGNRLEIALDDVLSTQSISRLADNQKPTIKLEIADNRRRSPAQLKKIWALINDLCDYTGDIPDEWEQRFKYMVKLHFGIDSFSLSDCSITIANHMILEILNFLFEEDIPFKSKTWDSIPSDFPKQMLCLKNKRCVICGKPADIAHYTAVGSGRNRNHINHVGMYINTLCRLHHVTQHSMGAEKFTEYYHIKPIKVTEEIAKQLHLGRIDKDD